MKSLKATRKMASPSQVKNVEYLLASRLFRGNTELRMSKFRLAWASFPSTFDILPVPLEAKLSNGAVRS